MIKTPKFALYAILRGAVASMEAVSEANSTQRNLNGF